MSPPVKSMLRVAAAAVTGAALSGCVVFAAADAVGTVAATAVGATARVGGAVVGLGASAVGAAGDAVTTSSEERDLERYREYERQCRRERRDNCGPDDR